MTTFSHYPNLGAPAVCHNLCDEHSFGDGDNGLEWCTYNTPTHAGTTATLTVSNSGAGDVFWLDAHQVDDPDTAAITELAQALLTLSARAESYRPTGRFLGVPEAV